MPEQDKLTETIVEVACANLARTMAISQESADERYHFLRIAAKGLAAAIREEICAAMEPPHFVERD